MWHAVKKKMRERCIIFKKSFWKLLNHSYVQILFLSNYEAHDNGILKTRYSWKFYGRGSIIFANSFSGKYHETKLDGGAWKIISCTKSEPVLQKTLHQNISVIIVFFFFSQANLVFSSNLVLIEWFLPQFISLFTFW